MVAIVCCSCSMSTVAVAGVCLKVNNDNRVEMRPFLLNWPIMKKLTQRLGPWRRGVRLELTWLSTSSCLFIGQACKVIFIVI